METALAAAQLVLGDVLARHPRIRVAISTLGPDRLVPGSDWPFPMGLDDPLAPVTQGGAAFAHTVAVVSTTAVLGS